MHEQLFAKAKASGEESVYTRLGDGHPAEMYLGFETGLPAIMLISTPRPPSAPSLASLMIEARARTDGRWALVIRLQRPELMQLFLRLVRDIDEETRAHPDDCARTAVERLVRWQRMFAKGSTDRLDESALRGLAGELDFLLTEAIPQVGLRSALQAWVGPFGAHKDFQCSEAEIEIKTLHAGQRSVRISSLDQLTTAGRPLYLWTRELTTIAMASPSKDSIGNLVSELRTAAASDAEASQLLEDGLAASGYTDRVEYSCFALRMGPATCYHVREGFPRLQRTEALSAIQECRYELGIAELAAFKATTWHGDTHDEH